ncbi:DUF185-domain-containing protein [Exidia glandulosa HHB12029]|uniref:Protein arginine methyltransferase NDUFAF7 n=1 Tax=Exidia glandulosa HHB12029 TaxID=1314781 RepID=A0A165GIK9_EXIGL|nr:DUF185-domain-containing protein [Exidia glandulosa HHB12029]
MLRRSLPTIVRHARSLRPARVFSTKLERDIARSITATGPISFAKYMELCLQHPTEGYYAGKNTANTEIVGARGDFVTSPEISQHFGQLIAIWFLSLWQQYPTLPRLRVIELGPGRGTLVGDIVQTFRSIPRIRDKLAAVDLVETSATLADIQKATLTERMAGASDVPIRWWSTFDDVPQSEDFAVVIAHEFFDALPVHLIEKTASGWQEVLVGASPASRSGEDQYLVNSQNLVDSTRFRYVLSGPSLLANKLSTISPRYSTSNIPAGTRIEVSPRGYDLSKKIAQFISSNGEGKPSHGAALFVDYGDARFFSDSVRAFQKHKLVDVFHEPGQTDLTSNVDFALLREAVEGIATVHGLINQATFLGRMGLEMRLKQTLANTTNPADQTRMMKAAGRLVDMGPMGMGRQYQFMGLSTVAAGQEVYPFVQENAELRPAS